MANATDTNTNLTHTPIDLLIHACIANDAATSHPYFMEIVRRGGGVTDPEAIKWARSVVEMEVTMRDIERLRADSKSKRAASLAQKRAA